MYNTHIYVCVCTYIYINIHVYMYIIMFGYVWIYAPKILYKQPELYLSNSESN